MALKPNRIVLRDERRFIVFLHGDKYFVPESTAGARLVLHICPCHAALPALCFEQSGLLWCPGFLPNDLTMGYSLSAGFRTRRWEVLWGAQDSTSQWTWAGDLCPQDAPEGLLGWSHLFPLSQWFSNLLWLWRVTVRTELVSWPNVHITLTLCMSIYK